MSKAGLKSVARAVLYGLIVKQAAVVVPFACHMAVLAGLDEFFQSAPEQFRRGFHSLYVVDSYSLVERMERNEVVPCCRPCLECVQNVRVDYESFLRWRQCRTSAVGHQSEGFKPSAPLFVQFGPPAVFGAAAETLQCRPPRCFLRWNLSIRSTGLLLLRQDTTGCHPVAASFRVLRLSSILFPCHGFLQAIS